MIAEVQVVPRPTGTSSKRYAHVDAAISAIQSSGLRYEVGALGTTVEGPPDEVWAALRAAHEACRTSGADAVITVIKVAEGADDGLTIEGLTRSHRATE